MAKGLFIIAFGIFIIQDRNQDMNYQYMVVVECYWAIPVAMQTWAVPI